VIVPSTEIQQMPLEQLLPSPDNVPSVRPKARIAEVFSVSNLPDRKKKLRRDQVLRSQAAAGVIEHADGIQVWEALRRNAWDS
jgi:hypothetical protein